MLLDLLAAFDTVDHDLMLSILENRYGITDTALQWYETYLRPRWMKVCVNSKYSSELNIKYGVPQCSCFGANNFVAYFAPIENTIKDTGVDLSGYADDHSLRKAFKPSTPGAEDQTILTLKNTVSNIAMWMTQMQLKLNCD